MPPISTLTWYEAPAPGAEGRSVSAQLEGLERVRSQTTGAALFTVLPASSSTTMSLGSDWQSVERHHVSVPLVITNDCVAVPTFIRHGAPDVFESVIDSLGSSPALYTS